MMLRGGTWIRNSDSRIGGHLLHYQERMFVYDHFLYGGNLSWPRVMETCNATIVLQFLHQLPKYPNRLNPVLRRRDPNVSTR